VQTPTDDSDVLVAPATQGSTIRWAASDTFLVGNQSVRGRDVVGNPILACISATDSECTEGVLDETAAKTGNGQRSDQRGGGKSLITRQQLTVVNQVEPGRARCSDARYLISDWTIFSATDSYVVGGSGCVKATVTEGVTELISKGYGQLGHCSSVPVGQRQNLYARWRQKNSPAKRTDGQICRRVTGELMDGRPTNYSYNRSHGKDSTWVSLSSMQMRGVYKGRN